MLNEILDVSSTIIDYSFFLEKGAGGLQIIIII